MEKKAGRTLFFFLFLLLLLNFAAYSNTFNSPPVLDDFHSFVQNDLLHVRKWTFSAVAGLRKSFFGWRRFLPMATFAMDYASGKGRLSTFHRTNLIIHLLSTLAVFFMSLQVFLFERLEDRNPLAKGVHPWIEAWVTAGLWSLHPVQTNAVTYMVQRMASMVTLFFVLSVAFYLLARRFQMMQAPRLHTLLAYGLSGLCGILSFFCKENSAMLPVVLLAGEVFVVSRGRIQWKAVQKILAKLPRRVYVPLILFLMWLFWKITLLWQGFLGGYAFRHFTLWERLLTEMRIVSWYVSLLAWPDPRRLSLEHDVVLSTGIFHPWTTFASLLFLLGLAFFIFVFRRRLPMVVFGILWFLMNLVIESSIVPLELVFEHRLYLPSVGFWIAVVAGFLAIARKYHGAVKWDVRERRRLVLALGVLVCSIFTLCTYSRNMVWADAVRVHRDTVEKAPKNPRAHANLAVAYERAGLYPEAIEEARRAMALGIPMFEQNTVAANVIVGSYLYMHEWKKAVESGEAYLKGMSPKDDAGALPELLLNLEEAYERLHSPEKAFFSLVRAWDILNRLEGPSAESSSLKVVVAMRLASLAARIDGEGIDLDGDGLPDPGSRSAAGWAAHFLLKLGEYGVVEKVFLARSNYGQRPSLRLRDDERERLSRFFELYEERNRRQSRHWSFEKRYLHHPFESFRLVMASAYLIRRNRSLWRLRPLGKWLVHKARLMRPFAPDPYLLAGWYDYEEGKARKAVLRALEAVELDPEYAKGWLALGFFYARENEPRLAKVAFRQCLELYPGYPQRRVVQGLVASLGHKKGNDGLPMGSSEDRGPGRRSFGEILPSQ